MLSKTQLEIKVQMLENRIQRLETQLLGYLENENEFLSTGYSNSTSRQYDTTSGYEDRY